MRSGPSGDIRGVCSVMGTVSNSVFFVFTYSYSIGHSDTALYSQSIADVSIVDLPSKKQPIHIKCPCMMSQGIVALLKR